MRIKQYPFGSVYDKRTNEECHSQTCIYTLTFTYTPRLTTEPTYRQTPTQRPARTHAQVVAKSKSVLLLRVPNGEYYVLCCVLYIAIYVICMHGKLVDTHFWVQWNFECAWVIEPKKNCGSTTRHTYRPGASIETKRFRDGKFSYNNKWKWQQRQKRQDKLNKDQTLPLFVLIFPPPQPPSPSKKTG